MHLTCRSCDILFSENNAAAPEQCIRALRFEYFAVSTVSPGKRFRVFLFEVLSFSEVSDRGVSELSLGRFPRCATFAVVSPTDDPKPADTAAHFYHRWVSVSNQQIVDLAASSLLCISFLLHCGLHVGHSLEQLLIVKPFRS